MNIAPVVLEGADTDARPADPGSATGRQRLHHVVGLLVAIALLVAVLPSVLGVGWMAIAHSVAAIPMRWLAALSGLWAAGLVVNTVALRASVPSLSTRRALTLSLTGSAVANVLPLGGAAGVALNYRMMRAWGYSRSDVGTFTLISNVWDVLGKVVLAAVVLPWVALVAVSLPTSMVTGSLVVATMAGLVGLVMLCALVSPVCAGWLARLGEGVVGSIHRLLGSARRPRFGSQVLDAQRQSLAVVHRGWARLSVGTGGYSALLFLLLWACLHVTGVVVSPTVLLAAFAVERLFTLAGITPGGAGLVEVGLAGVLLAAGGSALPVATAVLLYRALTFGMEIPVGGVWLAAWEWRHRRLRVPDGQHYIQAGMAR